MYEILKDYTNLCNWFSKCIQSKIIQTLDDGTEVYSTIYKTQYPLNSREIIHHRYVNADDQKLTYMINMPSFGLENVNSFFIL